MRTRHSCELENEEHVDIVQDVHGVSHVSAHSELGLYYGLGYCHGADRALQMLLMRVVTQGRASELLDSSPEMLASDRFFRRLNFAGGTASEVAKLSPADRQLAEAYCTGVNRALKQRSPWEFKLVGYHPSPWTMDDSIVIVRAMGYVQIAQHQADMERLILEMAQAGVSRDHLDALFPDLLDGLDMSLLTQVRLGERLVPDRVRWGGDLPRALASNNWVIAPAKTASGQAIFANDPHLEANRLPAIWYEIVLQQEGGRFCIAATIPGLPFLAIGRTNDLAWGPTYACMDAVDSWVEQCRDGCYRRVIDGQERWEPFQVRREVIRRKKQPDETVIFYENDHGVLDGNPFESGFYLATRWSAAQSGAASLSAGFSMFSACDAASGMRTLGQIEASWNWVMADRHGTIAYQMSGRMPMRRAGWSGLIPVAGWDPSNDWQGMVPLEALPRLYNPESGFIATANHDLNRFGVQRPITLPMGAYRADRIAELLEGRNDWDVASVQQMQLDVYSRQAAHFMTVLRPLLPAGPLAQILRSWDCCYEPASQEASLFERFYRTLLSQVFGQVLGSEVMHVVEAQTSILAGFYRAFDDVLLSQQSVWFGPAGRDAAFRHAAEVALQGPAQQWGVMQQFTMKHLMLGDRLPSWFGFNYGPVTLRGGRATIHQGQIFHQQGRETSWAPSYRFVTDFQECAAHTILAGGPSDRRFSRWYTSEVADWLAGSYKMLVPRACP